MDISELKKGDKVTVVEWKSGGNRSFMGQVLEVLHVEDPFVIITEVAGGYMSYGRPWTLNSKEVVLQRLSDEYVELMISAKGRTL